MSVQSGTSLGSFDGTSYNAAAENRMEEAVDALGAPAQGSFVFSLNPATESTITLNGTVVTFDSTPSAGEVQIGSSLAITLQNLLAVLNASADANILLMSYQVDGTHLYCTAEAPNTGGNALTLAASTSPASHATVSAATLTGGAADTPWKTRIAAQYGTASPQPITGSNNTAGTSPWP